ncbi:hypothetical protein FBUS_00152, partial [Fasciolopsis buskii]
QPAAFNGIEATGIIKEIIGNVVGASEFSPTKIKQWTSTIIEQSISQLARLNRPFKYIVSCVMMQRNGAGLQTGSACYWDSSTDALWMLYECLVQIVSISSSAEAISIRYKVLMGGKEKLLYTQVGKQKHVLLRHSFRDFNLNTRAAILTAS